MKNIFWFVPLLLLGIACGGKQQPVENDGSQASASASDMAEEEASTELGSKKILFFGNSLTAGYGLDPEQAFPALIQQKLDSLGYDYEVINAGLSGETTAGGKNRVDWVLRQKVDIMVLELGGNDGLRGISPEESRKNLQAIIDQAKAKYPDIKIILAGMQVPPNMGEEYATAFRQIYPELSLENDLPLIPFLLEGVGGEKHLNLPDGIHPNVEGQKIVAETVWASLETLLEKEPT